MCEGLQAFTRQAACLGGAAVCTALCDDSGRRLLGTGTVMKALRGLFSFQSLHGSLFACCRWAFTCSSAATSTCSA
jgi:hypothetical protein